MTSSHASPEAEAPAAVVSVHEMMQLRHCIEQGCLTSIVSWCEALLSVHPVHLLDGVLFGRILESSVLSTSLHYGKVHCFFFSDLSFGLERPRRPNPALGLRRRRTFTTLSD